MPHVPAVAEWVTEAFSLQWCSWMQPRWDSPGNRPGVGWRWPSVRRVLGRTGSLRASEVTAVQPGDEDSAPGRPVLALASPVPGQDRGTARAGLAQPQPLGTAEQRTQAGPPPGASDKAGGDISAWGHTTLHSAGPWCTGGDPKPLLQDRGWIRLCLKDPCHRELCLCDSDTGTNGCGWVPILKRAQRAAAAAGTPQQGTEPMEW